MVQGKWIPSPQSSDNLLASKFSMLLEKGGLFAGSKAWKE
jgi:hypothetical protein